MGLAQKMPKRDSVDTLTCIDQNERDTKVNARVAELKAKGFHIINVEDYDMPSFSDNTVKVTHIYYREVNMI